MKLPKPIRKLAWSLGGKFAASWVKDAAEGKKGDRLKRLYWTLAGAKTWSGLGFGLVAAVTLGLGEVEAAGVIVAVAAFLAGVGLVDRAWRTSIPEELSRNVVYRFLAANAAELAAVLAAVGAVAATCDPETVELLGRIGWTCEGLGKGLLGVAAGLAYLGLVDAAGAAKPPAVPLEE